MKIKDNSTASIKTLIQAEDHVELAKALHLLFPFEIVELITKTEDAETQALIFSLLVTGKAIQTFKYLPLRIQKTLVHAMPTAHAALLMLSLSPDNRTQFLQDLPRPVMDELVKLLPVEERQESLDLLGYPSDSVGRLMTPDYIAVKEDWTIEKVLDHIIGYGHDSETISMIYVIDNAGKLIDDIRLKDFFFVPRSSTVASISDKRFVALSVNDKDESVINIFRQYDRTALPVIDENGILKGIVTIDDVLRLSNRESSEDIQKLGGLEALDEPYLTIPFAHLIKKRAGWLVLLFLGEMFTATALGYFEEEISKAVVLALFLPLILSSGGNSGSQATTLIIRAMALGEVKIWDWWRILRRELSSGIVLGLILGTVGFLRVALWNFAFTPYGEYWLLLALTIFCSLIGVVLWGTLVGALLPLLLRSMRLDPATSSAPLVATMVDVTGLVIYFLIAIFLLSGTLL